MEKHQLSGVGGSPGKPDIDLVVHMGSKAVYFSFPADPVEGPSATNRTMGWDPVK